MRLFCRPEATFTKPAIILVPLVLDTTTNPFPPEAWP